jgi:DNA-binding NtrC family response regulator
MFNKKILIVDDIEYVRDPFVRFLNRRGFKNVITAAKADEALEKIEREKPDFIVLDIQLEDKIDGVEILRRTKAGLSPNSKIVMMSGHKDIYEDECLKLGAIEFWGKPMDPDIMIENIKRILSTL